MMRIQTLALIVAVLCIGTLALAQLADPPLQNWSSPPYWTPPAGSQARQNVAAAAGAFSASTESAPPVTILPFTAVTPCRLVDTRHGPKDVQQPGGSTPGYPRGSYASGEIRSYDLTLSTSCTGLPSGVGAWSLQFQFVPATQASTLVAWPYVSALGVGSQVTPSAESTMLGYTDRWTANSAIIPGVPTRTARSTSPCSTPVT